MARKIVVNDLLGLTFVSDPRLSPDGSKAACVVTRIIVNDASPDHNQASAKGGKAAAAAKPGGSYQAPRYQSRIHLFDVPQAPGAKGKGASSKARAAGAGAVSARAGGASAHGASAAGAGTEFTRSEYADRSPSFSPDGSRIAFLSMREEKGKPQLFVMSLSGGEPKQITKLKSGVREFAWHPDGKRIAFTSLGNWQDDTAEKGLPRRLTRPRYKGDGTGFLPTEPAQVYLVAAEGGESRKLSSLPEGASGLSFSPDGATLYLVSPADEQAVASFKGDVIALSVRGGKTRVLAANLDFPASLAPSPSGDHLAFVSNSEPGDLASPAGLWLLDLRAEPPDQEAGKAVKARSKSTSSLRRLSGKDLDVSHALAGDSRYGSYPTGPVWERDADGVESIVMVVHRHGAAKLVRFSLAGEMSELQPKQDAVTAFAGSGAGRANGHVFIAEAADRPGELWLRFADGGEQRLSGFNDAWCEQLELRKPEGPFYLPAARARGARAPIHPGDVAGRELVQFWTIKPRRPRRDKAAVLEVHGGPHTAYGNGFFFEFQLLAAHGYGVIFGNPRGGSSYGYAFATSLLGRYGSIDADDVMDIGDAGLKQLGDAKAPLHLTGGSYGGFMTNWLLGQTERFRSAVTQRSISNWTSMYGTSDIGPRFVEREIAGDPWSGLKRLWDQSPIKHVEKVVTPLLIIHSEEDHRCPIEQAEQFYTAIKRLGKAETEFLRVPGEGHELSRSGRPDRRLENLAAIVGWFERHP